MSDNKFTITSTNEFNSYDQPTGAYWSGNTYTGFGEPNGYAYVGVNLQVDEDGVLYFDFSQDGINWSSYPVNGFTITSGVNSVHTAWKGGRYMRPRFVGTDGSRTYFRLKTYYSSFSLPLTAPLNQSISSDQDATVVRSVLTGSTDGGQYKNVPVDTYGHLEMAIHYPLLPFGSVHTENLNPVFQTDAVYGINLGQNKTGSTLSGTATADDSKFKVSTGTTQFGSAVIQSRRRLRYRPGQGIVGRFAGKFTSPVANSYQIAGYGHAEDGVYFGYKDVVGEVPEFGILYVNRGVREIQTLTITTGSSTAENITITLNSVAFSVPVTNSGNIQRTVWEISQFEYAGWSAQAQGATVVFLAADAGNRAGTFSLSGTTAVGTFAETKAGVSATEQFIPQSEWNGDKLDGTGPSGTTIDPTKGNVFQIGIQYLGFGSITFDVETVDGNNATWVNVHTLKLPNTLTTTSFSNPSFPFTMAVYSAGSTTDLTIEAGSYAGFVEGEIRTRGNRFVYTRGVAATVTTGAYHALGTIMNKTVYSNKSSQVVVNVKEFAGHIEDGQSGGNLYLIKNGSLVGNPNFQDFSDTSSTAWDTAATSVTFSNNNQVVAIIPLGINGGEHVELEDDITLQPGETLTLAAKADTTTLDYCTAAVTTREDQ